MDKKGEGEGEDEVPVAASLCFLGVLYVMSVGVGLRWYTNWRRDAETSGHTGHMGNNTNDTETLQKKNRGMRHVFVAALNEAIVLLWPMALTFLTGLFAAFLTLFMFDHIAVHAVQADERKTTSLALTLGALTHWRTAAILVLSPVTLGILLFTFFACVEYARVPRQKSDSALEFVVLAHATATVSMLFMQYNYVSRTF